MRRKCDDACKLVAATANFGTLLDAKVSAGEYIEFLMTWVENQLNNEKIFPCVIGVPFPKNFFAIICVIFKRLFRVYAHLYHSHF